MKKNKALIIRFSSFGDIIQCSTVVERIAQGLESPEIDWVTRSEFTEVVGLNKSITNVISLNRKQGIIGLLKLAFKLTKNNYSLVYDAHNNLRSNLIKFIFLITFSNAKWITRPKDRVKRFLLFKLRINKFPVPFKGIDSYQAPLDKILRNESNSKNLVQYNFNIEIKNKINNIIGEKNSAITIVPSAAWPMKRWPLQYWKDLIVLLGGKKIYILGGKEDTFCEELVQVAPERVINLAGKLSLLESCAMIGQSNIVISADTGLLHVADVLGVKGISLMGPSAFGFTKSELIKTLEIDLPCRPCSKDGSGNCSHDVYQKCMMGILPSSVKSTIEELTN
jgi:heptosyltransferase-2